MQTEKQKEPVRYIGGPRNGEIWTEYVPVKPVDGYDYWYVVTGLNFCKAFAIHMSLRIDGQSISNLGKDRIRKLHEGMNYMDVFSLRKDA